MKILITGAHFTPAVAVIEELQKNNPSLEIVYVGRSSTLEGDNVKSIESQMLPSMGIKFIPIIAGRVQKRVALATLISFIKIPIGFIQALLIILQQKPDLVLSFGGYIAVPVIFNAWLWSIPIIIHEQTLVSGLANKFSAMFADRICTSFPENSLNNYQNSILTGNPLRSEILTPKQIPRDMKQFFDKADKEKKPIIFVTGGNQGSHVINLAVEKCLPELLKIAFIVHQTGDSDYGDFRRLSETRSERYMIKRWIGKEIGSVMSRAGLIISRAGANTLLEAAYLEKPVLAIPIPYIFQDEQFKNAKYFENLGGVTILLQSKLTSENLLDSVRDIFSHFTEISQKARYAKALVIKDAAKRVALELTSMTIIRE